MKSVPLHEAPPRVAIVGNGLIGKRLQARVRELGWRLGLVATSTELLLHSSRTPRIESFTNRPETLVRISREYDGYDIVFLAIPTTDEGEHATRYIRHFLGPDNRRTVAVVTCEKGALSHDFKALDALGLLPRIGHAATVGGGTQLLSYLKSRRLNGRPALIRGVINGTLNYVFDEASRGRTLGEAIGEAKRLGYAEPGADNATALIQGELRDVLMKTAIIYNVTLAGEGERLSWQELLPRDSAGRTRPLISSRLIQELAQDPGSYRFMVTIGNDERADREPTWHSFYKQIGPWQIAGGFFPLKLSEEVRSWVPSGVSNSLQVIEGNLGADGRYVLTGPGAGPDPTTIAMINDAKRLLNQRANL